MLQALRDIQREIGTTVVIVTHDPAIAGTMDRVLTLIDGQLVEGTAVGYRERVAVN